MDYDTEQRLGYVGVLQHEGLHGGKEKKSWAKDPGGRDGSV